MSDGKLEMATGHGVLPEYDVDDKWVGGVGRRLWMIVRKLRFTVNGQVSVTTVNPRPPHKVYNSRGMTQKLGHILPSLTILPAGVQYDA